MQMDARAILAHRLSHQRLAGEPFATPEAAVRFLVAVQSQDEAGARWSLGQRAAGATDASVAAARDAGTILRTHVLRPTWHFVLPEDIRWLLDLTAPRVLLRNGAMERKLGIDAEIVACSQGIFADALRDGAYRTRADLATLLGAAGIPAEGQRLAYIVMRAELDGLICSGPSRGNRQTYALLDERAPHARRLGREDALAELTRRFFDGHGPATLKDFVTWSGLAVAAAKQGLAWAEEGLECAVVDGETYWFAADPPSPAPTVGAAYLIPEYDEVVLTYKGLTFPDLPWTRDPAGWPDTFYRPVLIDDRRVGTWRRTVGKDRITLEAALFATLGTDGAEALNRAVGRYAAFMGLPVDLVPV